jgi:hypothetical protein
MCWRPRDKRLVIVTSRASKVRALSARLLESVSFSDTGDRAPHRDPMTNCVRVPQGAEVPDLVVAAKQAWALQHSRERVLDEILCLVAGTEQRPRGAIEHIDVIREDHRIERAWQVP